MLVYYRKYKIILKINDLKFTNCFWKQIYIINNKKNMCLTTINYFLFLENFFFFLGLNKYFFVLGWELCLVSCNWLDWVVLFKMNGPEDMWRDSWKFYISEWKLVHIFS